MNKRPLIARDRAAVHRAMSVAHGLLGDFEGAIVTAGLAREAAVEAGAEDEELLAILAMAGPMTVARTTTEASELVEASRHLATTPYLRARMAYQRGVFAIRSGERGRAVEFFQAGLPGLRAADDLLMVRSALQNLAILWIDGGELERAETALLEALEIAVARGEEPALSGIKHNLGRLAAHRGDVTGALALLLDSDEIYMRLTGASAPQHVARCEVLLSAGLFGEAASLALDIAEQHRASGDSEHFADALRVAARSSLAGGDLAGALSAATEAAETYEGRGRPGPAVDARRLAIEARFGLEGASDALLETATTLATRLEAENQVVETAQARLLVGRVAADLGYVERALDALRPVAGVTSGPIELRIQSWVARARASILEGNRRAADAAARSGLDLIDGYQTALGATDLRFGLESHGTELGLIGLDLAVQSGRPRRILRWMERTRARALRHPPVAPDRDEATRVALARLRQVESRLREDRDDEVLQRERRKLQEAVRSADRLKRAGSAPVESFDVARLIEELEDRALLEIAIHDGHLIGILVGGGRASRVVLGAAGAALDELRHARFAMRRGARRGRPVDPEALQRLETALLGDIRLDHTELVLVPPPPLMATPWAALPGLRDRVLTIAPSAEMWWRSRRRAPRPGRALVVGGPDLAQAQAEVEAVGGLYEEATLMPPGSTVDEVRAAMKDASVAHVVCHATFQVENPMFSSLRLGEGDLYVYDIERLPTVPAIVVLSACDSGYTEARAGAELAGLTSALLTMGTRSVVASVGLVPDTAVTSDLMLDLHRGLEKGLSPAAALSRAQSGRFDDPETLIAAASFVCVGA